MDIHQGVAIYSHTIKEPFIYALKIPQTINMLDQLVLLSTKLKAACGCEGGDWHLFVEK